METLTVLKDKKILLGVGGGVAAYKSLELIRLLKQAEAHVTVVPTSAALRFVTRLAFQALADRVFEDLFSSEDEQEMGHIRLAREADLVLVVPATANLMARMAGGHGDDLLTTLLLARRGPVLVAPAMNSAMWEHPATQRNVAQLKADGLSVVEPEAGSLACGEEGVGRLAALPHILQAAGRLLSPPLLAGRRVLVTAGPTREEWDPVRYLSNHSSGKMGWAIAEAAWRHGAEVVLIHGPVHLKAPHGVRAVGVETAREMRNAVLDEWVDCDALVMTAAVSDFRPETRLPQKLKKSREEHQVDGGGGRPSGRVLPLRPNPDILATVAKERAGGSKPLLVGFAAETGEDLAASQQKQQRKGCDLLLVNDVSEEGVGFGSDENRVTVLGPGAYATPWPRLPKGDIGARLSVLMARLLDSVQGRP